VLTLGLGSKLRRPEKKYLTTKSKNFRFDSLAVSLFQYSVENTVSRIRAHKRSLLQIRIRRTGKIMWKK
jgi:hypothetical protein